MRIEENMPLGELAALMEHLEGELTLSQVLRMRSILCDSPYYQGSTVDVQEWDWQKMVNDALFPPF